MLAGPLIFVCMIFYSLFEFAAIIFLLASVSDYLDGYFARKYHLESKLGAILDPIADKILITFTVIALSLDMGNTYIAFLGSMMLAREYWVSALRDFNAQKGNAAATNVTFLAKIKTFTQLATFCLYLFGLYLDSVFIVFLANFFLFLALIITIQTGLSYTIATFKK